MWAFQVDAFIQIYSMRYFMLSLGDFGLLLFYMQCFFGFVSYNVDLCFSYNVSNLVSAYLQSSKEHLPYKEGRMRDIGTLVGYTVLWSMVRR